MKDMYETDNKKSSIWLTFLSEFKYFLKAMKVYMAVAFLLSFIGYFSFCLWNGTDFFDSILHSLGFSLSGILFVNLSYCTSTFICILIDKTESKTN
ncbi:hypothetical protein ACVV7K_003829 [Cronobacter sakazakii]